MDDATTIGLLAVIALWSVVLQFRRLRRAAPMPAVFRPVMPIAINLMLAADPVTPVGYERQCARMLMDQGWTAQTTAGSGDQGIDVLAQRGNVKLVVQCKLYSRPVGNAAVQQVLAGKAFVRATHAAVVSNQSYTSAAYELANATGVHLLQTNDLQRANALFI